MKEKYILFDLDGTLSDSAPGITKSVAYALERFGISEKAENLHFFVGPPLVDSFMLKYGMTEEQAELAISFFRERFSEKGIFENNAYDGIEDMLKKLKTAGKVLIVATSKPEVFARSILERYGFVKYFDFIGGACLDEKTRMRKSEVIEYCLSECHITNRDDCVMVGDRHHDIEGAAECKIKAVGVLYGYGDREELVSAGAVCVCDSVEELCVYLIE